MREQTRAAALPLLLLSAIVFLQAGCVQTAYVSDKINQTMTGNSGVLAAAPGAPLTDLTKNNSLNRSAI